MGLIYQRERKPILSGDETVPAFSPHSNFEKRLPYKINYKIRKKLCSATRGKLQKILFIQIQRNY